MDKLINYMSSKKFKITKSLNNNYVLSLRDAYGTKAIAEIATPEELIEAREWVNKFYEGDYKAEALEDLALNKKMLKYKNGAVVHGCELDTNYWYVDSDNMIEEDYWAPRFSPFHEKRLANKNVFLTKEEARSYVVKKNIYNEIEKQITIINHANNWVADWTDDTQEKYYLQYIDGRFIFMCYQSLRVSGVHYMCKQALDWLLSNKVNDEQRKIWVEGV